MARVMVVGSAVLDFVYTMDAFPEGGAKFKADSMELVGGGCAANAAVAIARLGGEASLIARFGNDNICEIVCSDLRAEGVDLSLLDISDGRSAVSSVYVDASGERQIMAFRGSDLSVTPKPLASHDDVVLADTRWPAAAKMAFASTTGPTVLDGEAPVPRDLAMTASHVVFSEQGLTDFAGIADVEEALLTVAQDISGWVCVTRGAQGVLWVEDGVIRQAAAFRVAVKDTLGAGDIWHGAFALMLAERRSEEDAVQFASAAAALKCTGTGRQAAPNRQELNTFLKDRL